MTENYHQLADVREIEEPTALQAPRARALLDTIRRHRDYATVQLLQHPATGKVKLDCIVVDVECDGVPPANPHGILYRERLALLVPDDPKQLIEVLMLRTDFPVLMHQNQGMPGAPASLCLYFEPAAAVTRTWTPQSFLRRIQWWLEKSARDELHPADQPVDQLFFATKYELVLPWNFPVLQKDPSVRYVVVRGPERSAQGFSCFLEAIPLGAAPKIGTAVPIQLMLPPVAHGFVERDPANLGQLADILSKRGVDLLSLLRSELQERIDSKGASASDDDKFTVILLQIPICRTAGASPVRMAHRAFLMLTSSLELGVATSALCLHDHRYFKDVMNIAPTDTWRAQNIFPMDVLSRNDTPAARAQSGIEEEGPDGVLIGAGSLGSAMINLWGRAGWGKWYVIDKDYIKPHNLSRHVAYADQIGYFKADVVAGLHAAAMYGASEIKPLNVDATEVRDEQVRATLAAAHVVIDASTTLEYPRLASTIDTFARHVSVFVTPNGNAAVLLAEDAQRLTRLRTLEAQYYRSLLENAWGRNHLDGNRGTFWSGASCRDISLVMPYARIINHASTLAEQVQQAVVLASALIRVWQRDPQRGSVEVHDVPVAAERRITLGDLDLFIDAGIERQMRDWRTRAFPNETGGIVLGYYDFNVQAVIVVAALPAPIDSKSGPCFFERGVAGLPETVAEASRRTAGIVGYIGEWHSHPPRHSASPSRDDFIQLADLALGMAEDGLPALQLIVGDHDLQILQGTAK